MRNITTFICSMIFAVSAFAINPPVIEPANDPGTPIPTSK